MRVWNAPSAQVVPGWRWQVAHSICATVMPDVNTAPWSIGCRSEPACSTMFEGAIWPWQSAQDVDGCGSGVTAPPGVAE